MKTLRDKMNKPTKDELLLMLDEMLKTIEQLPAHALILPVNHYDLSALIIILLAIFRSENASP